jgi:hypothetical protein
MHYYNCRWDGEGWETAGSCRGGIYIIDQPCHVKCIITIAGGTEMAGKLQGPAATDTLTTGPFVACWALSLGVPTNV